MQIVPQNVVTIPAANLIATGFFGKLD